MNYLQKATTMKRTIITPSVIFLFLAIIIQPIFSQTPMTIKHGCNFAAADNEGDVNTYDASTEANQIVERMMKLNVLPQNFIIKAADIKNAVATTEGKQRYILYSTTFLENFKKEANTQWAAYCVLAHEIGHHLSNHDLEEKTPSVRKRFELEADRFAGGIMFRLGATLEEAQAGVNTFSLDNESQTHPPKRARLEALAVGWKQAQEQSESVTTKEGSVDAMSDEKKLYDQAVAEKDVYKAIELLDQALEIKEDYADAYLERGKRKIDIENVDEIRVNYYEALKDLDAYISLRPKNPLAFIQRGYAYRKLNRDKEAVEDYNRAIRLNDKNPDAYLERAYVKMKLDDNDAALKDIDKATILKPDFAEAYYVHGNIQYGKGDYTKAITDFDKALKADPQHLHALNLRAAAKQFSHQYAEAIADFNQVQKRHPKEFTSHFNRGECYQYLGKHREAIVDFDTLLKKNDDNAEAYLHRGISKQILGQKDIAMKDLNQYFVKRVSPRLRELTDFKVIEPDLSSSQMIVGCLFVDYNAPKDGIEWLDLALASNPNSDRAKACKEKALKKK